MSKAPSIHQRATNWIIGNHTGASSKTIWSVCMGADLKATGPLHFSPPWDSSDFGRCHKLLQLIPEWRERLPEVAAAFPIWGPLVREWDKLAELYQSGQHERLYKAMGPLLDEGRKADGQVADGPGCWKHKNGGVTISLGRGVTLEF